MRGPQRICEQCGTAYYYHKKLRKELCKDCNPKRVYPRKCERDKATQELYSKIKELYLAGKGTLRIAKELGIAIHTARYACKVMGITETTRMHVRRRVFTHAKLQKLRKPHLFTETVKQSRFEEEHKSCQWCHRVFASYHEMTYHHWIPISFGGSREPWNCMVLCKACHTDNFEFLHFGRKWEPSFILAPPRVMNPKGICLWCGRQARITGGGVCQTCHGFLKQRGVPRICDTCGDLLIKSCYCVRRKVFELSKSGMRNFQIAKEVGMSQGTICVVLKKGLPEKDRRRPHVRPSQDDLNRLIEFYGNRQPYIQ